MKHTLEVISRWSDGPQRTWDKLAWSNVFEKRYDENCYIPITAVYMCSCLLNGRFLVAFFLRPWRRKIQQLEKMIFTVYMVFPIDRPLTWASELLCDLGGTAPRQRGGPLTMLSAKRMSPAGRSRVPALCEAFVLQRQALRVMHLRRERPGEWDRKKIGKRNKAVDQHDPKTGEKGGGAGRPQEIPQTCLFKSTK